MLLIQIAGRLGADVETRFLPDGTKVSTVRVAANIRRQGEEQTVWVRVSLWGERWDKLLPYLTKGSAVIVTGELARAPETYTDKNGQTRVGALEVRGEILRFSPFGKSSDSEQTTQSAGGAPAPASFSTSTEAASGGFGQPFGAQTPEKGQGAASDFAEEDVPF